mmetsp:Transcript_144959/g.403766  ORF Transcript_144959/g.403766 Transcript_144959/m.403766 type:complete len:87 (-) Transcript_144959:202-462(-)
MHLVNESVLLLRCLQDSRQEMINISLVSPDWPSVTMVQPLEAPQGDSHTNLSEALFNIHATPEFDQGICSAVKGQDRWHKTCTVSF